MGILDKLKFGKKKQAAELPAIPEEAVKELAVKEQAIVPKESLSKAPKQDTGRAYQILIRPILSEKGTSLASTGKYMFAVHPQANKPEIKKSIQRVYNVHVVDVNIVKMPGKNRRYGRSVGRTTSWKKAIITVAPGEKIPGIIESVG